MLVLGISGSPRKGGNSEILLDEALKGASEKGYSARKIILQDMNISGCMGGLECTADGECVIEDDMKEVYPLLLSADIIVVASPIYFGTVTAQLKALIDRCQAIWTRKEIMNSLKTAAGRKGFFISTSAKPREDFFKAAAGVIKNFFATINIIYAGELFTGYLEKKGDIFEYADIIEKAHNLVRIKS